jgi:hypothetical protein
MTKKKLMQLNLGDLLKRDDQFKTLKKQEEEKEKINVLRGGNTGVALGDGNYTAECPRKTFLRYKGFFTEAEENRGIMFEGGLANETILIDKISRHLPPGFKILTQSQCATSWTTASGIAVTGSPDIVVADDKDQPHIGIEVKQICSLWTGMKVLLEDKVSVKHLAQSAHYMSKLGLPEYKLIYVSYVDFQLPYMKSIEAKLPKEGGPMSEHFEYGSNGKAKKMLPFRKVYELRFNESDQFLEFREEGSKGFFTKTIICEAAIEDFFQHITTMDKNLGPRPLTLTATGEFETYSMCDYCKDMKPVCDSFEGSPSRWLKEASKLPTVVDLSQI